MSTLQLTNSSNLTASTGVFFAGASPTDFTMPWGRDLSGNSFSKEFVFSPGHLKFHKHPVYGHVGLVTFRRPKKPKRRISPALASLKAELVKRREAGAFENNESLADRWAKKDLDIDDNELAAGLKEIRTMWKQDLDSLLDEG